jgi:hypothetical protein
MATVWLEGLGQLKSPMCYQSGKYLKMFLEGKSLWNTKHHEDDDSEISPVSEKTMRRTGM